MPAFERQSPYYLWDALPELFVRIDAIEPPPMDYEGLALGSMDTSGKGRTQSNFRLGTEAAP